MNKLIIGKNVFINGPVTYGDKDYKVCSAGTMIEAGDARSLVNIEEIDGDKNVNVFVYNEYIQPITVTTTPFIQPVEKQNLTLEDLNKTQLLYLIERHDEQNPENKVITTFEEDAKNDEPYISCPIRFIEEYGKISKTAATDTIINIVGEINDECGCEIENLDVDEYDKLHDKIYGILRSV